MSAWMGDYQGERCSPHSARLLPPQDVVYENADRFTQTREGTFYVSIGRLGA